MKLSARKKHLFILTTLFLSVGAACLVTEFSLRLTGYDRKYVNPLHSFHERDSRIGYRGKANFTGRFHGHEFDVVISHDEHGFRKHETPSPSNPNHRVFVLGDSFTWGWGVAQGKDRAVNKCQGCGEKV
jgi:hypothetical protein